MGTILSLPPSGGEAESYVGVVRFVTWLARRRRLLTTVVVASVWLSIVPVCWTQTHGQAARARTWIYTPSGAQLVYALDSDACDHAEVWWDSGRVGRVLISGNPSYSYAYARRISRDYWRLAEVAPPQFPHLGTLKREGKRWALRNKKARLVIYTSGPDAVEAALAYLTFGRDCTTVSFP
jgi:hypothetical protein